jgi:hypothetical protein
MRAAYIGNFSPYHTEVGVADALERTGWPVARYHLKSLGQERFLCRGYELVLTTTPHLLPDEFWAGLKARGAVLVAHYFDWIWGLQNRGSAYGATLPLFDLTLSTDGFDSKEYEERGVRRLYFPQGINPKWHFAVSGGPECDVAFIGNGNGERSGLFDRLRKRYDFRHYGQHNEARGPARNPLVAGAKVMLCTSYRNDVPGYWSNRVYQDLAGGGFVLHAEVEGLERYFKPGVHLDTWADEGELFEKIDYYLSNPRTREQIARAGHREVMKKHTWCTRAEEMWEIFRELGWCPTPT